MTMLELKMDEILQNQRHMLSLLTRNMQNEEFSMEPVSTNTQLEALNDKLADSGVFSVYVSTTHYHRYLIVTIFRMRDILISVFKSAEYIDKVDT